MKGKIGLVIGLGAGYVLGSRAGRERYEQIKTQWLKVWNLDPVQEQVSRVQDFAKSQAAAVPGAVWTGAVKVLEHENYTFYNPRIQIELAPEDAPFILFEGTCTAEFANHARPTPRHNYNQILYRLDFADVAAD